MKQILLLSIVLLLAACGGNGESVTFSPTSGAGDDIQHIGSLETADSADVCSSTQYVGEYSIPAKEGENYGTISIHTQEGNIISFDLSIGMGTPPYNMGELSGKVEIVDGKGVFKNDEYGDCILDFVFTDNSVRISHQEGGYGCGFGMNVYVNGTFVKKPADKFLETGLSLDPLTADKGVVINGVKWATRNVATPGTFAATPEDAGMFYKWNNKKAWAVIGNEVSDWDDRIFYDNTWAKSNDPSPAGWHVPTDAEIRTLLLDDNKVSSEWTTQNGVIGRKFTDKATGNSIFFPAVGYRSGDDGTLNLVNMQGNYWTSTTGCPDCSYGMYVCDYNVGLNDGENRNSAYNIRSVAD